MGTNGTPGTSPEAGRRRPGLALVLATLIAIPLLALDAWVIWHVSVGSGCGYHHECLDILARNAVIVLFTACGLFLLLRAWLQPLSVTSTRWHCGCAVPLLLAPPFVLVLALLWALQRAG